jgi:hypothetical protein
LTSLTVETVQTLPSLPPQFVQVIKCEDAIPASNRAGTASANLKPNGGA